MFCLYLSFVLFFKLVDQLHWIITLSFFWIDGLCEDFDSLLESIFFILILVFLSLFLLNVLFELS